MENFAKVAATLLIAKKAKFSDFPTHLSGNRIVF
jgi:hypothetical protein